MAKRASAPIACVGTPKIRKPRKPKGEGNEEDADAKEAKKQPLPKELLAAIAAATDLDTDNVKAVLNALPDAIATNLRLFRKVAIPNVVLLKLKDVKGTKEVVKTLFDKQVTIPAKDASVRVYPLVLKPLKLKLAVVADV